MKSILATFTLACTLVLASGAVHAHEADRFQGQRGCSAAFGCNTLNKIKGLAQQFLTDQLFCPGSSCNAVQGHVYEVHINTFNGGVKHYILTATAQQVTSQGIINWSPSVLDGPGASNALCDGHP